MSVVKDVDLEVMPTSIFLNGDDDDDDEIHHKGKKGQKTSDHFIVLITVCSHCIVMEIIGLQ